LIEDGASNVRTIFKVTHKNNNQSSWTKSHSIWSDIDSKSWLKSLLKKHILNKEWNKILTWFRNQNWTNQRHRNDENPNKIVLDMT
jgi:hypothetical protein